MDILGKYVALGIFFISMNGKLVRPTFEKTTFPLKNRAKADMQNVTTIATSGRVKF